MNTVPATEVKRRGIAALEEGLKRGPVHIIKSNRLACVVLTEEDYAELLQSVKSTQTTNLWELLDNRPWQGHRSKKEIDLQIKEERESWAK